jgi:triacylglycerol esterase/lipase EstA (alpha/beta hydrolase family)
MLPNITNVSMSIEERAANLAQELETISKRSEGQQLHIVTHSFCGIDSRAAISLMGAAKHVKSLTTVCTPHQGSRLIDNFNKHPDKYRLDMIEKNFEVLGMSVRNVKEFESYNIEAFN